MPEERILVVEDETIVAMDLTATLQRLGFHVVGVLASGEAAIEAAETLRPDLILMDIRLQGAIDGTEAAHLIHERHDIPIVFLTAHADEATLQRAKDAAPHGYIVKPFDERDLPRTIGMALQRHRAEQQLRARDGDALWASEERYRLLVDAILDYSICTIDLEGRIVSWNTGAEKITGYRADEVIGQPISLFYPEGERDQVTILRELETASGTTSVEGEAWRVRKDGTRFVAQTTRSVIRDRAGRVQGYATITRDITDRRLVEAQLMQTQKLETLGKLAGGIAHDFNNMLMVILSRADLLLKLAANQPKQHRFLEDIRAAAKKSAELTQQLLAAARRQVMQPQIVDLNDLVQSTMRLLSASIGEDIDIHTDLQPNLWPVHADPGKLHQVLMNLTLNARDAMAHGGALTIETRNFQSTPSYRNRHPELPESDHVMLIVSDTGHGMSATVQQQIFDPFFSTKETGTGLGLAVVRGIVEQTGGRIWLYSEIGQGTTFKIFFPRYRDAAEIDETPSVAPEEEVVPSASAETILLVEDEELLRTIIEETLAASGYRVLSAATPAEALTMSRREPGAIDLLLTDVVMPGINGRVLSERLRAERRGLKVVFMSGYTDDAIVHQRMLDADVLFLEKPTPPDVLLQMVRKALDG